MVGMMMTVFRRFDYLQSTAWISVVSAATPDAADFQQVIVNYLANLAAQLHGNAQILEDSNGQFRLVAHGAWDYAASHRNRQLEKKAVFSTAGIRNGESLRLAGEMQNATGSCVATSTTALTIRETQPRAQESV